MSEPNWSHCPQILNRGPRHSRRKHLNLIARNTAPQRATQTSALNPKPYMNCAYPEFRRPRTPNLERLNPKKPEEDPDSLAAASNLALALLEQDKLGLIGS